MIAKIISSGKNWKIPKKQEVRKMKGLKKKMAALTAAALCLTSMPLDGVQIVSAATSVDSTVKLKPTEVSIFNDTNGDGLGEFEGWGTSLCWWANRIGYSDKLTEKAASFSSVRRDWI